MRLVQTIKGFLGLLPHPHLSMATTKETTVEPAAETVNVIYRVHAALDAVYGKGWSKDNPHQVAKFLQALATKELATEVGAIREILATGTGAVTVGVENR